MSANPNIEADVPNPESVDFLKVQLFKEISRQTKAAPSEPLIDTKKREQQLNKWSMESRKSKHTYYGLGVPASREKFLKMWSKIPGGLEPLTWIKTLSVRQHDPLRLTEDKQLSLQNLANRNAYDIVDEHGHRVYSVVEALEDLKSKRRKRRFLMELHTNDGRKVMSFIRRTTCCGDGTEVHFADGSLLGSIVGKCNCYVCTTHARVLDLNKKTVLLIEDHGCCSGEFAIVKPHDKTRVVAYITKGYSEDMSGMTTHTTNMFVLEFKGDREISPVIKAILITAVFYFDFKYYEGLRTKLVQQTKKKAKKLAAKNSKLLAGKSHKLSSDTNKSGNENGRLTSTSIDIDSIEEKPLLNSAPPKIT